MNDFKNESLAGGATRRKPAVALARVFSFFLATAASAETAVSTTAKPSLPDAGVSLLRVTGALVFVIALFLGLVWLFRNWQRFVVQRGRAPKLYVLEVRSLGGRHSLYVVGYEQDRFLVATSPAGVNMLTHLPQATEEAAKAQPAASVSFSQALTRVLKPK